MAEHPRTILREAVIALLIGASTDAVARVADTAVDARTKLPAISVYTLRESVSDDDSTHTELARDAQVEVVGFVAHADSVNVAKAMDRLAKQIEDAIAADSTIADTLSKDAALRGTEMEIREGDGHSDPLVGIVTLTYTMQYRTSRFVDEAPDDFLRVDATTELEGGIEDDTVPAEDQFDVRTP